MISNFLEWIWNFLLEFWPVRIIDAGAQGVKFRQNGSAETLMPGWHLFIPKLQRIVEIECQYQNVDCGLQSLTTEDGTEVTISLNVGYEITDLSLMWVSFQHLDTSLKNMARGHAAEIFCSTDWEAVLQDPTAVQEEILDALKEDLQATGVHVTDVTLDQLSRVKTFRLLQSQTNN